MDVICIGEMLIDFTPGKEENSYVRNPGGAPANVAIGMKRNGLDVGFLGKLGNDDFGVFLKNTLSENKVKILCPELTNEAVTTMAFVTLYKDGERSFTFVRNPGADILLTKEDIKERDIDNCRLCHAGSVSSSQSPSREAVFYGMELAHLKEKLVSFDINYRNMIWSEVDCKKEVDKVLPFVDFLKISEEELYFVGGEEHIVDPHDVPVLGEELDEADNEHHRGVLDVDDEVVADLGHDVPQGLGKNDAGHGLDMVHTDGLGSLGLSRVDGDDPSPYTFGHI